MKNLFLFLFLSIATASINAQLIINELSQGPSGAKEYVELLVIGNPVCGASNTVDLRGWIIDDNNSWHGAGSGAGIAVGHVRFASISQWASVKIGTLILIYNDVDVSAATAALTVDSTDANSDCVIILPISSTLLEKNITLPSSGGSMTTYNVGGLTYSPTGNWVPLGMSNSADAFHTVSPLNYDTSYHAIGWGSNTDELDVYYSGSQSGLVIYMANIVDNNPFNSANYLDSAAASHETPGAANNVANAQWIASLNNSCQPFTAPVVNVSTPAVLTCATPSTVLSASSSSLGLTYNWSDGTLNSNTITVTLPGTYTVIASDVVASCSATVNVTVSQNIVTPNVSIAAPSSLPCNVGADTLVASSTPANVSYNWGGGIVTPENIIAATGNYSVTVTDTTNGCTASASVTVTSSGLTITAISTNTTCGGNNGSASVTVTSGTAVSYLWNNGDTTAAISNLIAGSYSVTVYGTNGCSSVASVSVDSSSSNSATISSDKSVMCSGDSAQICAPVSSIAYLWNTGETTRCINTKLAGNYYVTVTENGNCTVASNSLAISVYPLPPVSVTVNGDTLKAFNSPTYQWYFNNTVITGANSDTYIATQTGNYSVAVSDTNGCIAVSTQLPVTVTGIGNLLDEEMEIGIFPNPSESGMWNLQVGESLISAKAEIFDNEGRLIHATQIENFQTTIALNVAKGIYFLKVSNGQKSIVRKLICL